MPWGDSGVMADFSSNQIDDAGIALFENVEGVYSETSSPGGSIGLELNFEKNDISDVSVFSNIKVKQLKLYGNQVIDFSPLKDNALFTEGNVASRLSAANQFATIEAVVEEGVVKIENPIKNTAGAYIDIALITDHEDNTIMPLAPGDNPGDDEIKANYTEPHLTWENVPVDSGKFTIAFGDGFMPERSLRGISHAPEINGYVEVHFSKREVMRTVHFEADEGGALTGEVAFEVANGSRWDDVITVPTATADTGYYFAGWSPTLPDADALIEEDAGYTAQFKEQTPLGITRTVQDGQAVYNGANRRFNISTTYTGLPQGHTVQLPKAAPDAINGKNAGGYAENTDWYAPDIIAVQDENGTDVTERFSYPQSITAAQATITPKPATIQVKSETKYAGAADPAFSGTVSGLVNSADLGRVRYHRHTADAGKKMAGASLRITATYTASANYKVTVKEGRLTILARPTPPIDPPITPPVDPPDVPTPPTPITPIVPTVPTPNPDPTPPEPEVVEDDDEADDEVAVATAPESVTTAVPSLDVAAIAVANSPVFSIGGTSVPLFGRTGAVWGLCNLVLTIVGVLLAIVWVISYFVQSKATGDTPAEGELLYTDEEDAATYDEAPEQTTRKTIIWRILGVVTAAISAIVFFVTQDLSLPMAIFDKWTILMAVLFIAQIVFGLFMRQDKPLPDDEREIYSA